MKKLRDSEKLIVAALYIMFSCSFQLFAQIGSIIPSYRRVGWRNLGYEGDIPRYIQNYANVKAEYIDVLGGTR